MMTPVNCASTAKITAPCPALPPAPCRASCSRRQPGRSPVASSAAGRACSRPSDEAGSAPTRDRLAMMLLPHTRSTNKNDISSPTEQEHPSTVPVPSRTATGHLPVPPALIPAASPALPPAPPPHPPPPLPHMGDCYTYRDRCPPAGTAPIRRDPAARSPPADPPPAPSTAPPPHAARPCRSRSQAAGTAR